MLKRLTLSSWLLLSLSLGAQTARDYVHRGAQRYIFGDEPGAKTEFTTGLQRFPTDEELRQMLALIREQQKKPQPQDGKPEEKEKKPEQQPDEKKPGENAEPKPGEEQKEKPGDKGSPPKQGADEKQSKPEQGEDAAPMPEKKPEGELKSNPSESPSEKEGKEAEAEEAAEAKGEMTERQAKALLDSLKSEDDRVRLIDPKDRKRARGGFRDW